MADMQAGGYGPRSNDSAVESQLENVARALGEDIDRAQIHESAMAHICCDPQISDGPRKQLQTCMLRGGILWQHRDTGWTVNKSGLWLHINWDRHGGKIQFWDPDCGYTTARPKFYRLVSNVAKGAGAWSSFRDACLAQMEQPRPLTEYDTVLHVLEQNVTVRETCPLLDPSEPIEQSKRRERLALALFLAGVAPPPKSLGLEHHWKPAAVAVRDAWKLPSEPAAPAAPDAAGGDLSCPAPEHAWAVCDTISAARSCLRHGCVYQDVRNCTEGWACAGSW